MAITKVRALTYSHKELGRWALTGEAPTPRSSENLSIGREGGISSLLGSSVWKELILGRDKSSHFLVVETLLPLMVNCHILNV